MMECFYRLRQNKVHVGRQTANGLLNHCTKIPVSQAKPGDLIFFKGTYDVKGASHVGIYVGEGMMLHCGSPIQYTSVNTNYWRKHFYTYARING
ncbi:MAG: C40 family peptidase [Butyrivibrio sp.]|nr:C40 family peptidase [Butyrivibrio sp.]